MRKQLTVITGGSSGLGLACASCMAHETTLVLCARGVNKLAEAKKNLEAYGADVILYPLDASDRDAVQNAAAEIAKLGDIVHVIHTAGVSPANTGRDDILRINLMGPIHVVEAFYPVLAGGGTCILFGSTAGYALECDESKAPLRTILNEIYESWRDPGFLDKFRGFLCDTVKLPEAHQAGMAYSISKRFVKYFVYANVQRFASRNCRILSVSPGSYLTPMHQALIDHSPASAERAMSGIPLKRWGHPYEIGKLVQFLCSKGAGYITGVDILADGGCSYAGSVTQID
jgi:NAD(P)-dependent dehydrogenase (short-subunit alcohol dehydrogenase family)